MLAGIGLLAVWGMARHATVPTLLVRDVVARDIGDTANWAFVRLGGVVTRYPAYDEGSGYLGFWIDDSSGEILVAAYRSTSRALISAGNVPLIGDRVAVQGTLRVKLDSTVLVLNAPDHLAIERPEAVEVSIAQAARYVHQKVQVRGQVREVRMPYEGLTVLHVRDETGGIDVIYGQDMIVLSGSPAQVLPGDSVSVRGAVTSYKGNPQISLDTASGLRRIAHDIAVAARRQIGEIGLVDMDGWVRVQGAVMEVYAFSAGSKCVLDDGTGEIALILWSDLLDTVTAQVDVRQGAWLDVQGVVADYRGELELIPELPCDVRALTPSDSPNPPVVAAPAATLAEAVVSVPSQAVRPLSLPTEPNPTATPTAASTATATPTVAPAAATPTAASTATVTPTVASTPAATVTPYQRTEFVRAMDSTGLLTAAHVGQQVTILGWIEEVTQFASGVNSGVNDGSGPVTVWMPQDIYESLGDRMQSIRGAGWWVGSLVRVTGRVDQYKDGIEVIPSTALDVVIVEVAAPLAGQSLRIHELSASSVGKRVIVEAGIVSIEPFSAGVKMLLDDGSARITLLLWQNVYDAVPDRERLTTGTLVRVAGKVQEYMGELEIVPGVAADVSLAARD